MRNKLNIGLYIQLLTLILEPIFFNINMPMVASICEGIVIGISIMACVDITIDYLNTDKKL